MPIFENGSVRIRFEEAGSGFPMLVIPGGGLNAKVEMLDHAGSFNPLVEFTDSHRCVALDIRNANGGGGTGPLEVEKAWDAFTDDQLALMDHLGIKKFVVTGFCIGGPLIWNLIRRAPDRVVAAVLAHPSGFRPEQPDLFYQNNITGWAPKLLESRRDITRDMVERFLHKMYRANPDFVFSVNRDFVRACKISILIMPDDAPAHPYAAAMETARLAPNAQVSLYPWREPSGHVELALRHVRTFLKAHTPATE
jgi:pimeloyl-ACP methyl ester carboxylesterase